MSRRGLYRWKIDRPRAAALLAIGLAAVLASGHPARAQDPADGRTTEAITVRGLTTLSPETLLHYLGLAVGQPLDEEALDQAIRQLWGRGLIDDILVESQPGGSGGVAILVTVAERPVLRSLDYQGLKRVSRTDVQDKIASLSIRAREGDPLSLGELQRIEILIEELYRDKGYRFAQAGYTVEDAGPGEKRVVFRIDEGDRVRIADVDFEGNEVFGDARLRWAMKKTKESGLISRMMKKDVYDPGSLAEDLDRVRDLYRGAGYKNVVLGEPRVEVTAASPGAPAGKQKRRMTLILPVEEGERWRFGEVTLVGNTTYTDQALLRAFHHRPGSWLRAKVVDEGVKAVADLYHNSGYIFASVEPELVEKADRVADVVVHVQEGERYKVGRIEIAGNERTRDKVLRRELRLAEGGVMNATAVRNSIVKINQLGYFKLDAEEPVEIDTDTEKKTVDLLFKGEEAGATEVQLSGGWSEPDGLFGQLGISTKNFLGRGEQLGVSFQAGEHRDSLDLSYAVPWLLDRPQSLGIHVYDQAFEYGAVTDLAYSARDRQGAAATYGRNFRLFQSASLRYERSREDARYNVLLADGRLATAQAFIDNSSLQPAYVFDSRNDPLEPSRGKRLALTLEYAGGFLGGDNQFLRPEAAFSLFRPLAQHPLRTVLAVNVKGGWIHPLGSDRSDRSHGIPTLERYFLGGDSVRGHATRSIYLRDAEGNPLLDASGAVLGGDSFLQLNLEYHVLLGGPLRLVMFADAGNVFGEGQPFDLSNLRTSVGVELRVFLPVLGAPLRFTWAENLDPLPRDRFKSFQFNFGTSF